MSKPVIQQLKDLPMVIWIFVAVLLILIAIGLYGYLTGSFETALGAAL